MRLTFSFVLAGVALGAVSAAAQGPDPRELRDAVRHAVTRAYQGRDTGQEQTDRFSGKYRIGRDGRVSIQNISGDITVTAGSGDEVSVEAVSARDAIAGSSIRCASRATMRPAASAFARRIPGSTTSTWRS